VRGWWRVRGRAVINAEERGEQRKRRRGAGGEKRRFLKHRDHRGHREEKMEGEKTFCLIEKRVGGIRSLR